ncbi:MAG: serine--tRNA ligase [Candidatus Parcubacteria bacterium]|nr:MAG: serine--tRNA ligase [Candidatus Parcubacteria bacterium]
MIDIKNLLKYPDFYKKASKLKGLNLDNLIDILIDKKKLLNSLIKKRDDLKSEINKASTIRPKPSEIENLKKIKDNIKKIDNDINFLKLEIDNLLKKIPNPPLDSVPVGNSDKDNIVVKYVGEIKKTNFKEDYLDFSFNKDLIDVQRASKVSGSRFAFIKNKLVLLELAILSFVFDKLTDKNFIENIIKKYNLKVNTNQFIPILPPVLIKKEIMNCLGYLDSGLIDFFEVVDSDLYLIGTAEHSIVPYFKDEILEKSKLPLRFLGFSTCFRKEAGSYGRDTRGIIRVHQFDKIEMVSFCLPDFSLDELYFLLSIEEELMKLLELPYRIIERCTADLGHPTAKGFDIEVWIPSENRYRETHSCSLTTDYQSRRLNIKYRDKNKLNFVYILNATAFALGRIMIAILENHRYGNTIKVPKELLPYTKFSEI